ncbi:DNA-directed RNA polymerase subunit beta', partial [Candidatus Uhrbacteria bacterium]|nr:DNA-directed RNA polymerase subunit beta' [Candidatus Uhrbacteria bacterium]
MWDILEEVVADAYVLLNRAPTLHRLGIQAFKPKLIEGKAIQIHPLVCDAYNADFDGDQMAVHVPLTREARREARHLMLSTNNLLKPSDGEPIARPGKDMVWGCFYLTMIVDAEQKPEGERKAFGSTTDAKYAQQIGKIGLHEFIRVRVEGKGLIETTVGRILVSELLPPEIGFQNEALGKKQLSKIVRIVLEKLGNDATVQLLDKIKALGFKYSTLSGFSWGMSELPEITQKQSLLDEGDKKTHEINEHYRQGLLTKSERHSAIVGVWEDIKYRIEQLSKEALVKGGSAYSMIESGARGSISQLTQMIGMKGLVASASGETVELPVKSSFKEGTDALEFFISSHGVRKGLTDTALKTANAGYLTRRLVDVAQDVVIRTEDCGESEGVVITKEESDEIGEPITVRILGRFMLSDLKKPGGRKVLVKAGDIVTEDTIRELESASEPLKEAHVRSVLTCKARNGLCQKCYGYDLAYNKLVNMGTAVGIIAAQSIGEPGTQLTMRTFHMGGVAGKDITQGLPRVEELFESRTPKHRAIMSEMSGKVEIEEAKKEAMQVGTGRRIVDVRPGQKIVRVRYAAIEEEIHKCGRGAKVKVKDGDAVVAGDVLCEKAGGDRQLAGASGTVKIDKTHIKILHEVERVQEYVIPPGYALYVKDGQEVCAGDPITEGHLDLHLLFETQGRKAVEKYVSKEIQFIYASQGQKLNNKHIEVIVRQMFSRVRVTDAGDTDLLPGEVVELSVYLDANDATSGKKAESDSMFLGITKTSLSTNSWLSAASFQETSRVLINAAVTGKIDELNGLKENVIIGRLIPAGTGMRPLPEDAEEFARPMGARDVKYVDPLSVSNGSVESGASLVDQVEET